MNPQWIFVEKQYDASGVLKTETDEPMLKKNTLNTKILWL